MTTSTHFLSEPPNRRGVGGGSGRSAWWRAERLLPQGLHAATWFPLVALGAIIVVLLWNAIPAIRYNGLHFFTSDDWNIGNQYANPISNGGVEHFPGESFGLLPLVVGTFLSSIIAVVLAVPIGIATALIVVEKLPRRLSAWVGFCMEMLAGIPSALFGIWGFLTFGPWLARHVDHPIADHMPDVPVLDWFTSHGQANGIKNGADLLTAGLVLAIMILPIVAATSRDLFRQVPKTTYEGAVALGMTDSESVRAVTFPWVRSGIIGASMLGLSRALGETIAVAMVGGALLGSSPHSLFSAFNTIAAAIVTQLDNAVADPTHLTEGTLAEIALVLMAITLASNIGARWLVRRGARTAVPVGRGV